MGVLRSAAHRRAESRFWGVFIIAVHRAFVLGLGARPYRGIVELSEGVLWLAMCDTLFACFSSSNIRHLWQTLKHHLAELEPLRNRLLALPFVLVWRRGRDCLAGEGAGSESC